jgi:hypothetical protein
VKGNAEIEAADADDRDQEHGSKRGHEGRVEPAIMES